MAVSSVTAHWNGWQGSDTASKQSFQVMYLVNTDSASDGPGVVLGSGAESAGLPALTDAYVAGNDSVTTSYVQSRAARRRTSKQWEITVTYAPANESSDGGDEGKPRGLDENGNPVEDLLLEADDIEVDVQKMTRVAERGIFRGLVKGNVPDAPPQNAGLAGIITLGDWRAITNSANVTFDPPFVMDYTRQILRITRNQQAYNGDLYLAYHDTVNSIQVVVNRIGFTLTIPPYAGRCEGIRTQRITRGNQILYRTSFEFHIDKVFGWRPDFLDQGFHKAPDNVGDIPSGYVGIPLEKINDINGLPITEPIRLDGFGQPLPAASPNVYMRYTVYPEISWAPLAIWD